jgi:hypothetical protein
MNRFALIAAAALLLCPLGCDGDVVSETPADDDTADLVNEPPAYPQLSIYPDSPLSSDSLKASIDNYDDDPDGDILVYTYTWLRNDVVVAELTTAVVEPEDTARDQTWTVEVIATDGEFTTPVAHASAVILNTPPGAPTDVAVEPAEPTTDDDLSCVADLTEVDYDDDPLTSTFRWFCDFNETTEIGEVVAASQTATGEAWYCEITISDGAGTATATSGAVEIL